jgi:putative ABC transport system substrate-binding protein
MRRREFVMLLGGAATASIACPFEAHSQSRTARVDTLMVIAETDPDARRLVKVLETQLDAAGWHKGHNLEITYRWGASDPERLARYANELVLAAPDVLVAFATPALVPLHKATTTIPTVFTSVSDPVAQGFVASLAHPGGNITGFSNYEPNIGTRWLQLLKEVAPYVTQTGVMFNPRTSPYNALWMHSIEMAAPSFGMSVAQTSIQSDDDIQSTIGLLGTRPGSSLIVLSDSYTYEHSALIASLAASKRIPAVYAFSRFVHDGGLIAYGVDLIEQFGRAAVYIDRVLKGEKTAELPVQGPTRYTMAINLKTAKALGLTIAPGLIAAADEVIE